MLKTLVLTAVLLAATTSVRAADLLIDEAAPDVGIIEVGDWDGPYVGVFGGYGRFTGVDEVGSELEGDGFLFGVNAGANFTLDGGIVVGVVGDIAWSGMTGTLTLTQQDLDWAGSLRGRVGFDLDGFMPYVTGGLAVGHVAFEQAIFSDEATMVGWTAGAGLEIKATDSLSVDLLYRYSDYGTTEITLGGNVFDDSVTSHQVSAGLNWHF